MVGLRWTAQTVGLSGSVTRQITNTDVDAVIVTLTWPQIQILEDDGDIRETQLSMQFNCNMILEGL